MKVWGLIYSCISTKATAIWAVPSYDSAHFLAALHRHCSTYGVPKYVLADHGPNIVARIEGQDRIDWDQVRQDAKGLKTTWELSAKGCRVDGVGSLAEV